MNRSAATLFLFIPLLALAVTACGDDDAPMPDAQVPDAMPVPPDATPPTPELVVSTATLMVNEGSADGATLTVKLSASPAGTLAVAVASGDEAAAVVAPASLSFGAADYATEQTLTITAPEDADGNNESVTLTLSAPGLADVTVEVTVIDDDSLNVLAEPTTVTVSESNTSTFTVSLTVQPNADVTVTVASSDEGAASVDTATLTFTPDDYDQPQTVTVTGVSDADVVDEAVTVTLSSAGLTDVTVAVTVDDDDIQALQASTATLSVSESGTAELTVRLSNDPLGAVEVSVTSSDTGAATAAPATLNFDSGNYDQPQTVTVAGVGDVDGNNEAVTLTLSAAGLAEVTVSTTVLDDDTLNIAANPTTLTVAENGTATFDVSLTVQPNADVTVTVASGDAGAATVDTAELTFTPANYDQPQTVTATGVSDEDVLDEAVIVTLSSAGLTDVTVAVTVDDDDIQTIQPNTITLSVTESGTAEFTVRLSNDPSGSLSLNVASIDAGAATVSPTILTFDSSNYDQPQTVTVTGVSDDDVVDESPTVTISSAGLTSATVDVTVDDDDIQTIQPSATTVAVTEGGSGTFTVRLSNDPLGTVAVNVASGDSTAASVSPATLTFDAGNYDQPQTVTVTGVSDADADNESVSITLSASGIADATVTASLTDITPPLGSMYVRGSFNAFDLSNEMTYAGARRYTEDVSLNAGTHELKIADANFDNNTTFSVSAAGAAPINLDTPTPLERAAGTNNNTLLTITQPGIYRFELLVGADLAAPVLTVSLVEAAPFAVNMFVRIAVSPGVTNDIPLVYQGNRRYRAVTPFAASTIPNFKIADSNFSATTTFSKSATQTQFISLGTPTTLVVSTNPNIQTLLLVGDTGNYQFDLNATSTTNPVLTISLLSP
jgi:hypothetical protein